MLPLTSIIVPVYNVENYLDRCIESIVNQTNSNLEIILVDDGSCDASSLICDKWAEKDNRIIVLHTINLGVASARNKGIKITNGMYIGFVDSDDYIDPSMYESMINLMKNYHCDIVECGMKRFCNSTKECTIIGTGDVFIFDQESAIKDFILNRNLTCTVPNMLVISKIAKATAFDEGKIHEDILWPYRAYLKANQIIFIDSTYYFYFQRPNSIMNSEYSINRFDGLEALNQRAKLVKNDFPDYYDMAERAYLGACMYQYQYLCRQSKSKENKKYKKLLHQRYCQGDIKVLFTNIRVKYKLWNYMFIKLPSFTCNLRNFLKIGL